MQRLFEIYKRLRNSEGGCPWDKEQTLETYGTYLREEMQELVVAIENGDAKNIAEEIGDNFWNLVFVLQLAKECYGIDFEQVLTGISEKLIRRHPYVYGDASAANAEEAMQLYQEAKAKEKNRSYPN